jgi:hypothetical protein
VWVFLLFPDGRLLTARWRVVSWIAIGLTVVVNAWSALKPGPLAAFPSINNPFGAGEAIAPAMETAGSLAFLLLLLSLGASALSLILRFRRARGEERQQLKWLVSAAAFMALAFMIAPLIWFTPALEETLLWPALFLVAVSSVPMAIGVAVLRYRLYDIDLIIRRTLIYSGLTACLATVYFGSVIILQQIVRVLTGTQQSELVTVISTLLIAASFVPLHQRVQSAIDRRFYRRKYDAARTLEVFSRAIRDEVDLLALREHLLGVVDETMQPAHVSLWLRKSENEIERT